MNSSIRPIAVFGASGAQGGPVAQALLAAGRSVRAIARTEAHLQDLAAHSAETVALDLADTQAVQQALTGVSGAFVHLPFVPVVELIETQARSVAAALVAAHVPFTVFTLSGPAATTHTDVISFDTKATVYKIMQAAGVPMVIFQPVGYLGNLSAPFAAPNVVKTNELRYSLPAEHRQPWISVEDQARLAIAALERPDLAGRTFRIGEQLTGPEIAAGISAGLGRTVRYVSVSPQEMWSPFAPIMGEQVIQALIHDYNLLGSNPPTLELDRDTQAVYRELGIEATPVSHWAASQNWEAAAAVIAAPTH